MPTELHLHGLPSVCRDGQPPLALSAREAALLAWLHFEGPTPRSRLAGLLWPGGSEAQARANLRQMLARLRRSAGTLLIDEDGLLSLAGTLHVAQPGSQAGALTLLHGLDFDDAPAFAEWLEARREHAQRERQRHLLAQGQSALEARQTDAALAAADALLADQPENEEAWRLRMEVLYRRGDRAGAIAAWDACRHVLRASFGVTPSAATQALGRLIVDSDESPALASPTLLPLALRRPPQLVGRAAVLQALGQALALGQSVVLTAPGGMGKSRLLQQLLPEGPSVLSVQARPGDARLAGALLGRLLAAALQRPGQPEPPAALAPLLPGADAARALRSEVAHRRVLQALQGLFDGAAATGLCHVVLDDLHFADEASLELLQGLVGRWLAAAGGEQPTLQAVIAARAEELSPGGQALCELVALHAAGRRLELPPLARADLAALVGSLAHATSAPWAATVDTDALAAALHGALGGNPAFVLEALRSLWLTQDSPTGAAPVWTPGSPLPVPPTLVASVLARLQRLPPEALQLAQLAAAAEGDFDPGLAAAVFDRTPLALAPLFAQLESAQVFQGAGFSHDLVFEAVQRSLPAALASPLHGLVAEHLQRRGAAPARIAHHLLAAGQRRDAAPWLVKAAEAARDRWQLVDAARAWTAAAELYEAPGPVSADRAQAVAAALAAARGWLRVRRLAEADTALARAAPGLRGEAERAQWLARQVWRALVADDFAAAAATGPRLLEPLAAGARVLDADELIYALRAATATLQHGVAASDVLALCAQLAPLAEAFGGETWLGFALARSGPLLWDAQPLAAAADLERAWAALDAGNDPELRRSVANQLMRTRQALGDLEGALAVGEALRGLLLPDAHDAAYAAEVLALMAQMRLALGDPGAAWADLAAARARIDAAALAPGESPMLLRFIEVLALLASGRLPEAERALAAAAPSETGAHVLRQQVRLIATARLATVQGRPSNDALQALQALPEPSEGARLHRAVALAVHGVLPPEALRDLQEALAARGQRGLERSVALARAEALVRQGRPGEGAVVARRALSLARHVDAWNDDTARVWLVAGEVLAAAGAADEAAAAWQAGAAWVMTAAATLARDPDRQAWCEGHPVHRRLLALATGARTPA